MKRIYFLAQADKERYERYLNCEDFSSIIKAGAILFTFKHLKCQQCAVKINEQFDNVIELNNKNQKNTEDFFNLICRLSR
ncbi:MAG: hypothetical protein H0U57_05660 [Tatlockia sp.]|nr:hypothetical protein [Tatlockia sp.]